MRFFWAINISNFCDSNAVNSSWLQTSCRRGLFFLPKGERAIIQGICDWNDCTIYKWVCDVMDVTCPPAFFCLRFATSWRCRPQARPSPFRHFVQQKIPHFSALSLHIYCYIFNLILHSNYKYHFWYTGFLARKFPVQGDSKFVSTFSSTFASQVGWWISGTPHCFTFVASLFSTHLTPRCFMPHPSDNTPFL